MEFGKHLSDKFFYRRGGMKKSEEYYNQGSD